MELLKECNNKRVYGLWGGWIITEIEKKCKNKRADALSCRWTMIGVAKTKCKNKRFMH